MTISKETIGERKTALLEDLTKVRAHGADLEKQKLENVALQNALTGAIQQCDQFIQELDNESDADSSIPDKKNKK